MTEAEDPCASPADVSRLPWGAQPTSDGASRQQVAEMLEKRNQKACLPAMNFIDLCVATSYI